MKRRMILNIMKEDTGKHHRDMEEDKKKEKGKLCIKQAKHIYGL